MEVIETKLGKDWNLLRQVLRVFSQMEDTRT
jgi:hypothetical protein